MVLVCPGSTCLSFLCFQMSFLLIFLEIPLYAFQSCSPPNPSITAPYPCSMAPNLIKSKTTKVKILTPPSLQRLSIHLSGIRNCGVSGSTPFRPISPTHKKLRAMSHCSSQGLGFLVHLMTGLSPHRNSSRISCCCPLPLFLSFPWKASHEFLAESSSLW